MSSKSAKILKPTDKRFQKKGLKKLQIRWIKIMFRPQIPNSSREYHFKTKIMLVDDKEKKSGMSMERWKRDSCRVCRCDGFLKCQWLMSPSHLWQLVLLKRHCEFANRNSTRCKQQYPQMKTTSISLFYVSELCKLPGNRRPTAHNSDQQPSNSKQTASKPHT